jgi:hypothetical protein
VYVVTKSQGRKLVKRRLQTTALFSQTASKKICVADRAAGDATALSNTGTRYLGMISLLSCPHYLPRCLPFSCTFLLLSLVFMERRSTLAAATQQAVHPSVQYSVLRPQVLVSYATDTFFFTISLYVRCSVDARIHSRPLIIASLYRLGHRSRTCI